MKVFIDEPRGEYGVEPICKAMQIARSTYWLQAQRKVEPELRPQRAKQDDVLAAEVERVWQENLQVYGVRTVWRQLQREGFEVARCAGAPPIQRPGAFASTVASPCVSIQSAIERSVSCPSCCSQFWNADSAGVSGLVAGVLA